MIWLQVRIYGHGPLCYVGLLGPLLWLHEAFAGANSWSAAVYVEGSVI